MTKSLEGFLKVLCTLNLENLKFLTTYDAEMPDLGEYEEECKQMQDLINSFDFVKNE